MCTIYYKPHKLRKREAEFFSTFEALGGTLIQENFPIDPAYLERTVDTQRLVQALRQDAKLPAAKRRRCIEFLYSCPAQIKVALKPAQVSFDIVVLERDTPYYWEFHEGQHRKLTVDRTMKVFTQDGAPIEVPRFLQRLVRDVWRAQHFRPYTIVWSDWFAENRAGCEPTLCQGFQEFALEGKFSFQEFLQVG